MLSVCQAPALQASEEVTPEVQTLYAQAKEARQRGDDAAAIDKYRAILKLAPHLAAAYNNLGMLYFDRHDYAHAVEVLLAPPPPPDPDAKVKRHSEPAFGGRPL